MQCRLDDRSNKQLGDANKSRKLWTDEWINPYKMSRDSETCSTNHDNGVEDKAVKQSLKIN